MLGLLSWNTAAGRTYGLEARAAQPMGLGCAWVTLTAPERPRERRLIKLLGRCRDRLRALGVRTVIFAPDFPCREFFLERGLVQADSSALLSAKAGAIAVSAAKDHNCALLSCARVSGDAVRAMDELGRGFRYVVLDAPTETADTLYRACAGLGLTPQAISQDRTADVDAAVFLSPPRAHVTVPARCRAVFPRGGRELVLGGQEIGTVTFLLPERFRFDLPFPSTPILSAAIDAGKITPEEVKIATATAFTNYYSGS